MATALIACSVLSALWTVVSAEERTPLSGDPAALARRFGYVAEAHRVVTDDGYVLGVARVLGKHGREPDTPPRRPPLLLWHGMFGCSDVWMLLGPEASAGFVLADAGFDVWLGNARGNVYSRAHTRLSPNASDFWDFSWHEMGVLDVPATAEYVLRATGAQRLFFAGHSMGATAFFVAAAARPAFAQGVRAAFLLAPVVYISAGHSAPLERLVNFTSRVVDAAARLRIFEMPGPGFMARLCPEHQRLCAAIYPFVIGANYVPKEAHSFIVKTLPAGGSLKELQHYIQLWRTGEFAPLQTGAQPAAPYPLHRITLPIVLFRSDADWSLAPKDARRLSRALGRAPHVEVVPLPRFLHNDFIFAPQATPAVFEKIAHYMERLGP